MDMTKWVIQIIRWFMQMKSKWLTHRIEVKQLWMNISRFTWSLTLNFVAWNSSNDFACIELIVSVSGVFFFFFFEQINKIPRFDSRTALSIQNIDFFSIRHIYTERFTPKPTRWLLAVTVLMQYKLKCTHTPWIQQIRISLHNNNNNLNSM